MIVYYKSFSFTNTE